MNRDTANILQNAPSPWETASADTLKLFQSQQIQEMRLVEGDGHTASQPQAGGDATGILQPQAPPRDDDTGGPLGDLQSPFVPWLTSRAGLSLGGGKEGTAGNGGDGSLRLSMLSRPSIWVL